MTIVKVKHMKLNWKQLYTYYDFKLNKDAMPVKVVNEVCDRMAVDVDDIFSDC